MENLNNIKAGQQPELQLKGKKKVPIYEFKCPACLNIFDELLSYKQKQENRVECHECKENFKAWDNSLLTAPAAIIMGGIFTDLSLMQKKNKELRKKNEG